MMWVGCIFCPGPLFAHLERYIFGGIVLFFFNHTKKSRFFYKKKSVFYDVEYSSLLKKSDARRKKLMLAEKVELLCICCTGILARTQIHFRNIFFCIFLKTYFITYLQTDTRHGARFREFSAATPRHQFHLYLAISSGYM